VTTAGIGLLLLQAARTGDVNTYVDGDIIPVQLTCLDATFLPVDPDTVAVRYQPVGGTLETLDWDGANETPAVGEVAHVDTGTFEAWIPVAGQLGRWYCDAATTGAVEGSSVRTKWWVVENLA
jgi:hypothetical protein